RRPRRVEARLDAWRRCDRGIQATSPTSREVLARTCARIDGGACVTLARTTVAPAATATTQDRATAAPPKHTATRSRVDDLGYAASARSRRFAEALVV